MELQQQASKNVLMKKLDRTLGHANNWTTYIAEQAKVEIHKYSIYRIRESTDPHGNEREI